MNVKGRSRTDLAVEFCAVALRLPACVGVCLWAKLQVRQETVGRVKALGSHFLEVFRSDLQNCLQNTILEPLEFVLNTSEDRKRDLFKSTQGLYNLSISIFYFKVAQNQSFSSSNFSYEQPHCSSDSPGLTAFW